MKALPKNKIIEETLAEIKRIEDFTCEYWWPQLVKFNNRPKESMETPTLGLIIENIIKNRGEYCEKLRRSIGLSNF